MEERGINRKRFAFLLFGVMIMSITLLVITVTLQRSEETPLDPDHRDRPCTTSSSHDGPLPPVSGDQKQVAVRAEDRIRVVKMDAEKKQ